ncbi:ribonuclease H-like domain-containing protein [Lasiosphaeris hirsuta]|uniref:Ribonuclease H-like domain-containing protein n=1 Tax=Lasiosphaeris hirsuta TaxID=260670 RepID=A0AA40AQC3_9PEZI|nr:ribonuclease H-like domain-containing protein [Lasiosphaeris hirsuta]
MDHPKRSTHNTWHVSRGIVFAGDTRVVYPRLPLSRYLSTPSLAIHEDGPPEPLTRKLLGDVDNAQPATSGQGLASSVSAAVEEITFDTELATDAKDVPESENPDTHKPKAPFTPLAFKIPDELFQAAKDAAEGTPESFWSYALYRGPEKDGVPGEKPKVHYCKSKLTTERVIQQYFMDEKVIGVDLEWEPDANRLQGIRRNVSLVQIASASRIGLFHLARFPKADTAEDFVAPSLKKIMEDPEVTKVGVWIKGDGTRLRTYLHIHPRGLFELSHLYKLIKYSLSGEHELVNKKLVSMANQASEYFQLPLFKGQDVRSSNWSKDLKNEQVIYSASDAYASVQLYAMMNHHRESLNPTPPLPHHADLNLPIKLADRTIIPVIDEDPDQEPIIISNNTGVSGSVAFAKYISSLGMRYSVKVEEDEDSPTEPEPAATPAPTSSKITSKQITKHPKIVEAEVLAAQQRARPSPGTKGRAPAHCLRAYYLWHENEDFGPEEIAALLRDPPLLTSTVVSYIVEAIRTEKLPFETTRARKLLDRVSKESLNSWRYRPLAKACGYVS